MQKSVSTVAKYQQFRFLTLIVIIAFGAYLRLDQILSLVLILDEWHPVHELTYYSPLKVMGSFGHADYSIPLVLYYFFLMKFSAISELSLRFPMILAGLATLVSFPLALRERLNSRIVIIFAMLLAMSPFLISYARIGRPYALTLFGIYLAFWCLERATNSNKDGKAGQLHWKSATAFILLSGFIIWMHAITGPLLITPLLVLWWQSLRGRGLNWRPIILLTASVGLIMALAVLPPLLLDPSAIAGKSGMDSINWNTVYGALFLWFGTTSPIIVGLSIIFAALGFSTVWREITVARWIILGCTLTAVILAISKPWWIDAPLAFGRYLLPLVPVLLLLVATGMVRAGGSINDTLKNQGQAEASAIWTLLVAAPFVATSWLLSPLPEILGKPNSFTQDSYFQLDYRKEQNPIRLFMPKLPASQFWASLAFEPKDTLKIAVAPFNYATFDWPAPLWERDSHQRVIPAYLWGSCKKTRHGETPDDGRFNFRNAAHLKSKEDLSAKHVDYLAYYIHKQTEPWVLGVKMADPLPDCEAWVRAKYGKPDYEDSAFLVWRINPAAPLSVSDIQK